MQDHTYLTDWAEDKCPVHSTPIRKGYRFGRHEDATVYVFRGCQCAVCVHEASLQCGVALGHEYTYHKTYAAAEGRARLIVAGEKLTNKAFARPYV